MSAPGTPSSCASATPGSSSWDLPRHPTAARQARDELAASVGDLADDLVQVAQVLTSELVTNAIAHGEGPITLRVLRDSRSLTVQVEDRGSAVPVVREHDLTALSGRGMQLVEAFATAWGTESEPTGRGKTVWFELRL